MGIRVAAYLYDRGPAPATDSIAALPCSCERKIIPVITFEQLMTGMVMGTILIIIGMVPGLLEKWADGLSNIAETLFYRSPVKSSAGATFGEQRWLAALGMALIALSLFLFTSR